MNTHDHISNGLMKCFANMGCDQQTLQDYVNQCVRLEHYTSYKAVLYFEQIDVGGTTLHKMYLGELVMSMARRRLIPFPPFVSGGLDDLEKKTLLKVRRDICIVE